MNKKKIFLLYNHLLAEKNILTFFGKIQSVQFPTANNISKIHENRKKVLQALLGKRGLILIIIIINRLFWKLSVTYKVDGYTVTAEQ